MSENDISNALNRIPYGFYVLTSRNGDERNAMVINWFSQVSFEPQHVVFGLQNTAFSYGLIKESGKCVVNIFIKEDGEVVKSFSKGRKKNPEKFQSANYSDGPVTGVPVIDEAAAFLECEVTEMVDTGSGYTVVIAKVVGAGVRKEGKSEDTLTLLDVGWTYSG